MAAFWIDGNEGSQDRLFVELSGLRVVRAAMTKKRTSEITPDPIQAALLKAQVRTMRCLDKSKKRNAPEEAVEAETEGRTFTGGWQGNMAQFVLF